MVGVNLDLGTNVVATSEQSVKALDINLPQMTVDAASPTVKGVEITATGAIAQTTSGTTTFSAVDITLPEQTQTAGTVTTAGVKVTGGTVNSGTQTLLSLAGGSTAISIAATSTYGIQIGAAASSAGSGLTYNTTAPVGFYFDDGGAAITSWGECFTVGFVIPTTSTGAAQTGWPCATHIYTQQRASLTGAAANNMCALNAGYLIDNNATLDGFDLFGVSALNVNVNVASGCTVAAGTTLAAIAFSGNWDGTISGKIMPMVFANTNWNWTGFAQFMEANGCYQDAAAGSGSAKYLKVYLGDTLYTIEMNTA